MKTLILSLLILLPPTAKAIFHEENSLNWPFRIYQAPLFELPDGSALINGVAVINQANPVLEIVRMKTSPKGRDFYQKLAKPIVKTYHYGKSYESGVHLGNGIILTNHHVVARSINTEQKNPDCSSLSVSFETFGDQKISCEKIIKCSLTKEMDYCFFKIKDNILPLTQLPTAQVHYDLEDSPTALHYAIGNTAGAGIHGSKGKGISYTKSTSGYENIKFYAAVFGGNSGGAIFNERGEFIALVRAMVGPLKGTSGFNLAIPLEQLREEIEEMTLNKGDDSL